ncbi:MAG: TonB-dependent receptor, partial [Owenweeksia sp.]
MFRRGILTLAVLVLFAITALGQTNLLERRIKITPGNYTAEELINEIRNSGVILNFSGRIPVDTTFNLKGEMNVRQILSQIFDTRQYTFIQRNDKVLVIPVVRKKGYTFSGYVEEDGSHERLIGVNIYLPAYGLGTSTNEFGFFSLIILDDQAAEAVISFIGYERQIINLSPTDSIKHSDIKLIPESRKLEEVTIEASRLLAQLTQMSQISLSPAQLASAPGFLGEVDIIKSIQLLPGVQRGSEGSTNFLVRGGNQDQNLLLLDGVPVYNASHAFGFLSVFNSDALKSVELTTGGFPARYGGRLSSVLEVNMKEGNMKEIHGAGSIGLITSRLMLEGPILKDRTSFMISGRRTYIDLLLKPFLDNADSQAGYNFGDLNFKVNHKFSRKDRIYLSLYTGRDKLYSTTPFSEVDFKWGNYTSVLRWNHLYSDKLFGNMSAIFSQYRL